MTREEMEAFARAIKSAVEGGAEQATFRFADADLTFEKREDGSFTFRTPVESIASSLFPPAGTTPAGYPAEAPFVPDEMVIATRSGQRSVSLTWMAPREPEAVFARLEEECVSQGWQLRDRVEMPETSTRHRSYVKDGAQRYIIMGTGIVSFVHRDDG